MFLHVYSFISQSPLLIVQDLSNILNDCDSWRIAFERPRVGWFSAARIGNVSQSTNLSRFRSHYGSNPFVYSEIWEDLQTLPFPEAKISIDGVFVKLHSFLLALFFMKCYPTEPHLAATFKVC